ncbi:hypothetical protein PENTCL1PPCAC_24862 [Pristionchus entomophagus]|uniref:Uncharacterized protein n=1 Tax=Pristionchus entomophagus TaxID=358040 RepID=A0AAV5U7S0_9BILA|nr:hypothetical protein PENTCL1PPCAC_24862 [Pristionchus entomophagus]
MRSATSSTSSMASSATLEDLNDEAVRKRRLAGGQEQKSSRAKGAGLQQSILQAILVDPLPIATTPVRLHIAPRPPSIAITEEEEDGKENGGRARTLLVKDRSHRSIEDDEVFEIITGGAGAGDGDKDPDQVDVTMSTPLTPATPVASEMTPPGIDRTLGGLKKASSFLDLTSASTTSLFNRSQRPKSLAIEELPDEWRQWLRACTDGDIDTAKGILKREPSMLNWAPPLTGRLCGLHLAVRGNHLKMVTWLCLQGADVNQQTLSGYTPLHIAAQQTNRGMVNELRRLGADESRRDLFGRRYDHYATWREERRVLCGKESFRSCVSGPSTDSRRDSIRSRPPSIYSRDSMASVASSFGRNNSIRDTVRGFFRNTFKKAHSVEKLHL